MGQNHRVNHVLIQYYRSGKDYISEHSDKTIDVVQGSSIINVSLGAERVMVLRTKKDTLSSGNHGSASGASTPTGGDGTTSRSAQRIPLPHASMFVMGLETNKQWLHGIPHDNRPFQTKSAAEQAEGGERISLTFRTIGTFLTGNPNYSSSVSLVYPNCLRLTDLACKFSWMFKLSKYTVKALLLKREILPRSFRPEQKRWIRMINSLRHLEGRTKRVHLVGRKSMARVSTLLLSRLCKIWLNDWLRCYRLVLSSSIRP